MSVFGPHRDAQGRTVYSGGHAGGEMAASWRCPRCGHVWISALSSQGQSRHWRCSCGHDTRAMARLRDHARKRAQWALRKARGGV